MCKKNNHADNEKSLTRENVKLLIKEDFRDHQEFQVMNSRWIKNSFEIVQAEPRSEEESSRINEFWHWLLDYFEKLKKNSVTLSFNETVAAELILQLLPTYLLLYGMDSVDFDDVG